MRILTQIMICLAFLGAVAFAQTVSVSKVSDTTFQEIKTDTSSAMTLSQKQAQCDSLQKFIDELQGKLALFKNRQEACYKEVSDVTALGVKAPSVKATPVKPKPSIP